jgi:hypothetical protein
MEKFDLVLESEKIIFPDLEKRFREAEEELYKYKINMNDFGELYGEEKVKGDISRVSRIKEKFLKTNTPEEIEAKKMAIIFESVFNEHAELSNWLGENALIVPASEFDDIVNGVDMIAEFSEEERNPHHLGLGIDVTYGIFLKKKLEKIKEKIDSGKLSEIKYFHSDSMGFTGKLSQVPRVVVSIKKETLKELVELKETRKNKELANHFVQFQILEEVMKQLEVFKIYAERIGKNEIVKKLEVTRGIISKIYEEKKETVPDEGKRDESIELMFKQLELIFSS